MLKSTILIGIIFLSANIKQLNAQNTIRFFSDKDNYGYTITSNQKVKIRFFENTKTFVGKFVTISDSIVEFQSQDNDSVFAIDKEKIQTIWIPRTSFGIRFLGNFSVKLAAAGGLFILIGGANTLITNTPQNIWLSRIKIGALISAGGIAMYGIYKAIEFHRISLEDKSWEMRINDFSKLKINAP